MKKLLALILIAANAFAADFVVYGPEVTNNISHVLEDGRQVALTLTNSLPADEVYMLWPTNANGYGTPVVINQTEAWWVGPDTLATGETFAVYGRNLDLGNATNFLYCTTTSEWLTNTTANPYRSEFTVPTNWANGTYSFRMHNGKGREYGWSDALGITISDPTAWNDTTNTWLDVTDPAYGAVGDGVTDDSAAINAAINAADDVDWSTIYFPSGTYYSASSINHSTIDKVRMVGNGEILGHASSDASMFNAKFVDFTVDGLTFKSPASRSGKHLQFFLFDDDSARCNFFNSTFDQSARMDNYWRKDGSPSAIGGQSDCVSFVFSNCTFNIADAVFFKEPRQLFIVDSDFYQFHYVGESIGLRGGSEVSVYGCTAQHSNTNNANGEGEGRFFLVNPANGSGMNMYCGNNTTTYFSVKNGAPNENTSEDFMYESGYTDHAIYAESSTPNTVTLVEMSLDYTYPFTICVAAGTGYGQTRIAESYKNHADTIYLTSDWSVQPDNTSLILIGEYANRFALYKNSTDGSSHSVQSSDTADAGVEFYGGSTDVVVDGHKSTSQRCAYYIYTVSRLAGSGNAYTPTFFNLFQNGVVDGNRNAYRMRSASENDGVSAVDCVAWVGNIIRNHTVTNTTLEAHQYMFESGEDSSDLSLTIFDHNSYVNIGNEINYWDVTLKWPNEGFSDTRPSSIYNQYFIGNTTNSTPWSPSP